MREMRYAEAEDAAAISHVYATSWRKAYRGLVSDHYLDRLPDEFWLSPIRAWLGSGQMTGIMQVQNDEIIGACIYGRGRDEDHGSWGEIVSLYVLPEVLKTGAGSALLRHALQDLQSDGYDRVYLWVIDGNEQAEAFYRKHGFKRTSQKVQYMIGGENVTDVRYVMTEG